MPSADYIWPHTMNKKVREVVIGPRRRDRRRGVLPARPHRLRAGRRRHHGVGRRGRVQHDRPARPHAVPRPAVRRRLHGPRRASSCAPTSTRTSSTSCPAEHVEGLYGCLDYYRDVQDPFSIDLLNRYEARYPGSAMFTAGSACSGTYRALKLWESAVNEAGSLRPARRRRRARPRPHHAGTRRPGRDGARAAPRADEHVHRPLRGRHVPSGREPRPHRPEGAGGPMTL